MLFSGNTPFRNEFEELECNCSTCKHYQLDDERDEFFCGNEKSKDCGEYTIASHFCEAWEED